MDHWAALLQGVGAILWPLLAFAIAFSFRGELRSSLKRLRKARILGQEVELDASLQELERKVSDIRILPEPGSSEQSPYAPQESQRAREILNEAGRSPKVALILLGLEMEDIARNLLAGIGGAPRTHPLQLRRPAQALIQELSVRGDLPPGTLQALNQFDDVRTRIVHGKEPVNDDDVLRAVDLGLTILRALQTLPRSSHEVLDADIPLFADERGLEALTGVNGVRLLSDYGDDGEKATGSRHVSIAPTTRHGYYRVGKKVSWEWSPINRWQAAWYWNEEAHNFSKAWDASMEFTGRHLDEI